MHFLASPMFHVSSATFTQACSLGLAESQAQSSKANVTVGLTRTLVAMSTAICEVLRKEPRATFHDNLPDLVLTHSLENFPEITGLYKQSSHIPNNSQASCRTASNDSTREGFA